MPAKNVLVLESEKLLTEGMLNILFKNSQLLVTAVTLQDLENYPNVMEPFQPDIIITDEDLATENSDQIARFIRIFPKILLLVIHLEDNHVEVLNKEQVDIKELKDFLALLETPNESVAKI